jgi:hypothetical protein
MQRIIGSVFSGLSLRRPAPRWRFISACKHMTTLCTFSAPTSTLAKALG